MDFMLCHNIITQQHWLNVMTNRRVTTSIAFSGIGSPETSDYQINRATRRKLQKMIASEKCEHGRQRLERRSPINLCNIWCIECSEKCWEELLCLPEPPVHIFTDISEFVAKHLRKAMGLDNGKELTSSELRELIPFSTLVSKAFCVVHGKRCTITKTDLHTAGSPCTDHSSMGKGSKMEGKQAKLFYVWIALVRALLFNIIFHENVPQLGSGDLIFFLGDLYIIITTIVDIDELGWPCLRSRQYALLILKTFRFPQLGSSVSDRNITLFKMELDWPSTFITVFRRPCSLTWIDLLCANQDEVQEDIEWAESRTSTKLRHSNPEDDDFKQDDPNSYLWALQPRERKRFEWASNNDPGEVRDVQQNPDVYIIGSKGRKLGTLIKNVGILMLPEKPPTWADPAVKFQWPCPRAMHYRELFQAMGFPIYPWAQEAADGATCSFSLTSSEMSKKPQVIDCDASEAKDTGDNNAADASDADGAESSQAQPMRSNVRTRASSMSAMGNAMHVNAIGGMHLLALLKFPDLGSRIEEVAGPEEPEELQEVQEAEEPASSAARNRTHSASRASSVSRFLTTLRALKKHKSRK